MAITPIEKISIPTKSQEASYQKTSQALRNESATHNINAAVQTKFTKKAERTETKEDIGKESNHFDAKDEGRNQYESQQEEKRRKEEKARNDEETRRKAMGSRFNVTI
ncbi:MAG: hypothetical protein MJ113_07025 [Lachnospiraceae bacterium]|nr:hypothetical protein [Lachnospiraceae bacterium]